MERRAFIAVLVGAVASPGAVLGQPSKKIARIGVLWHAASAEEEAVFLQPLVESLRRLGYVEGQNIVFEHRFPAEEPERFKAMAQSLAQLNVDVLVTSAAAASFAAKAATKSIPIVFIVVPDPVETGLVGSFAHPAGNITGFAMVDVSPKRLELFKEAFPALSRIALLVNPNNRPTAQVFIDRIQAAGSPLDLSVQPIEVHGPDDFERAFSEVPSDGRTGVMLVVDAMFFAARKRIAEVALAHKLPVMAGGDPYVKAGVLMSYGPDLVDMFRRAGLYVDKIIRGARPSDLPVEQPTKYILAINAKTANAIGVTISPSLLARADEVIG